MSHDLRSRWLNCTIEVRASTFVSYSVVSENHAMQRHTPLQLNMFGRTQSRSLTGTVALELRVVCTASQWNARLLYHSLQMTIECLVNSSYAHIAYRYPALWLNVGNHSGPRRGNRPMSKCLFHCVRKGTASTVRARSLRRIGALEKETWQSRSGSICARVLGARQQLAISVVVIHGYKADVVDSTYRTRAALPTPIRPKERGLRTSDEARLGRGTRPG